MIRINLKPLSINKAFCGRRFKTPEHKEYEYCLLLLLKQYIKKNKVKQIKGFYSISFIFYVKTFMRSDVSNYTKLLEDCIVKSGLVEDDRFCLKMTLEKRRSDTDYFLFDIKPEKEYNGDI